MIANSSKNIHFKTPNCIVHPRTALHYAAENGYETATDMLIKSGALVDVTDYSNKKPIQYAIYGRNYHKFTHHTV